MKYTLADHPDHGNLHLALGEIKTLAERMNKGELEADQAEKEAERLRDLEASIEGISSVSPVFQHGFRVYRCMLSFQCLEMAGEYIVG